VGNLHSSNAAPSHRCPALLPPQVGCNLPSPGDPAFVLAQDPLWLVTAPAGLPAPPPRAGLTKSEFSDPQELSGLEIFRCFGVFNDDVLPAVEML